jgi:Fe-S-cluster containining protein
VSIERGQAVTVHPGKEAVVDFDPTLTFECVDDCTWCCQHGVMLYEPDFLQLADVASLAEATTQVRGQDFIRKEGKDREEHTDDDGEACFFLRDDGLCSLHAEHDWKPARCSVFPLEVTVEPGTRTARAGGDIHITVREAAHDHCEGLGVSERRVVEHLDAFLPAVLWDLDDPKTRREL